MPHIVGSGSQQQLGGSQQPQQLGGGSQQQQQQSAAGTPAPTQQVTQGTNSQVKNASHKNKIEKKPTVSKID